MSRCYRWPSGSPLRRGASAQNAVEKATEPAAAGAPAAAPAPAAGTAAPEIGAELQEVTVSASAITLQGYNQPTPVTSLGIQQLESAAMPNMSDALRTLPAFAGSSSPQNSNESNNISNGNAGLDQLDLRKLGPKRTLVLIDGQRLVNGVQAGGAETSNIPTTLVQRVDVVTGGASAIWGSDAVAGVVNYVLNHNFNGVEINAETSNNWQSDHVQYRGDLTVGTGFDDNRGHIEASVSELRLPDSFYVYQAQGFDFQRLVNNPACSSSPVAGDTQSALTKAYCAPGQPWLIHANNVGQVTVAPGGLVTGCLNAAGGKVAGCSLTNTYFTGPNATPQTFNLGNVSANYFTNGGTNNTIQGYGELQGIPQRTDTGFALGSFKINDHVEATAQFDFGYTSFFENSYDATQAPATIYAGNPYIPASVQSQMTAGGISALQVGTTNTNPFTGPAPNVQAQQNSVGMIELFESRRLMRGVLGFDGDLGDNWSWNAYYERSETHQYEAGLNNIYKPALAQAENAVTVGDYGATIGCPAGAPVATCNPGATTYTQANFPNPLGLAPGTITCASNLLSATSGGRTTNCAPLNIFGQGPGVASQAAIQYVNGLTRDGGNTTHTNLFQDVAAATVQGKLPVGLAAGPIAMAAGLVYRHEEGLQVNCGAPCNNVLFPFGNFGTMKGNYNVKEGSLELNAPILKDSFVKDLSIDAAWRGIDYSTSGFVQTYKFGVVSQLIDAVRVRASYSRDIRAGDMAELFQQPQTVGASTVDPRTGQSASYFSTTLGNPNLVPEAAETRTAGFVFTPFQGFTSSIDWYYIRIKNVITSGSSVAQIENGCKAGNSADCELIVYGTFPGGCTGPNLNSCPLSEPLVAVLRPYQNANVYTTSGLDFLADYRIPFMSGALDFNVDTNYAFELRYVTSAGTCDPENGIGSDQGVYCGQAGNPKFRGTVATTYAQGPWLATIQARMIGAEHLVSNWTSGVQIDDNDIPFTTYVDLRLSYNFNNGVTLYSAMDNAFDRLMPVIPFSAYSGGTLYEPPFKDYIYDGYGRVWRLGVRAKF